MRIYFGGNSKAVAVRIKNKNYFLVSPSIASLNETANKKCRLFNVRLLPSPLLMRFDNIFFFSISLHSLEIPQLHGVLFIRQNQASSGPAQIMEISKWKILCAESIWRLYYLIESRYLCKQQDAFIIIYHYGVFVLFVTYISVVHCHGRARSIEVQTKKKTAKEISFAS